MTKRNNNNRPARQPVSRRTRSTPQATETYQSPARAQARREDGRLAKRSDSPAPARDKSSAQNGEETPNRYAGDTRTDKRTTNRNSKNAPSRRNAVANEQAQNRRTDARTDTRSAPARSRNHGHSLSSNTQSRYLPELNEAGRPVSRPIQTEHTTSPKVIRAKKMSVRQPNQKTQERSDWLRDKRTHLDNIESVRLQKALSASGVGSRREMEEWIAQGQVSVNGKVASLGDKVSPHDRVSVKGNSIKLKWADRLPRIIVYNKQEGEIVSRDDPKGRVSIFDRVTPAKSSRWVAIGRLDVNTMGMLIVTTSGELANRFAHPSFEVEREYSVRILGSLTTEQMRQLMTDGIELEDGLAKFQYIQALGGEGVNQWYKVVLKEGRNREVRRVFEHLGLTVSRLIRVRFGPVSLPSRLKRGQFYELNEIEVTSILKWAKMSLPGERKPH